MFNVAAESFAINMFQEIIKIYTNTSHAFSCDNLQVAC